MRLRQSRVDLAATSRPWLGWALPPSSLFPPPSPDLVQRSIVMFIFLSLTIIMVPFAIELLGSREGSEFNFFGPASDPPPDGLNWQGNTSEYGLAEAPLRHDDNPNWPLLYYEVVAGVTYGVVELNHKLWPGGAVWLAALLFLDATLAVGLLGYRVLQISKPTSAELAPRPEHQTRESLAALRDSGLERSSSMDDVFETVLPAEPLVRSRPPPARPRRPPRAPVESRASDTGAGGSRGAAAGSDTGAAAPPTRLSAAPLTRLPAA